SVWRAVRDAGIRPKDIQVAYCGYALSGLLVGQESGLGQIVLKDTGITGIPVTHVENACSSSACALREAWMAVASGLSDFALAMGVEKMTCAKTEKVIKALVSSSDVELESGIVFPGVFAMIAQRHMYEFGTTREQLAGVAVKAHRYGALNPHAHFQKEVTLQDVLSSPLIATPLRLLDCSPISDGAAAAILVPKELAKKLGREAVDIAASVLKSGSYTDDRPITSFESTVKAAREAYEIAGIGPEDIDVAEVHDCFSIAEIVHIEDLGFCTKGEGGRFIENGKADIDGQTPVNISGGLKAKGHPVGATGIGQIAELVWQLRGQAGNRQVDKARIGLSHCMGGFFHSDGASLAVHILKK
ncbi:MAG: thiolase domain-containing protein, partial [Candidatus Aminicenantes bacterium]|nr:thiolase domain-containing protein [Candidatus Aminicenantes bacterium]